MTSRAHMSPIRILRRAIGPWRRMRRESARRWNGARDLSGMSRMSPANWPRRGEVWWVAFDPSVDGEIRKTRPAIIVSRDLANRYMNRVQVVPLTSTTDRLFPSEAYVTVRGEQRKAMADQLTTASKLRLVDLIGRISNDDFTAVERAIRIQLAL